MTTQHHPTVTTSGELSLKRDLDSLVRTASSSPFHWSVQDEDYPVIVSRNAADAQGAQFKRLVAEAEAQGLDWALIRTWEPTSRSTDIPQVRQFLCVVRGWMGITAEQVCGTGNRWKQRNSQVHDLRIDLPAGYLRAFAGVTLPVPWRVYWKGAGPTERLISGPLDVAQSDVAAWRDKEVAQQKAEAQQKIEKLDREYQQKAVKLKADMEQLEAVRRSVQTGEPYVPPNVNRRPSRTHRMRVERR